MPSDRLFYLANRPFYESEILGSCEAISSIIVLIYTVFCNLYQNNITLSSVVYGSINTNNAVALNQAGAVLSLIEEPCFPT